MTITTIVLVTSYVFAVQAVTFHDGPAIGQHCAKLNGLNITMAKEIMSGLHLQDPSPNVVSTVICGFTGLAWLNKSGGWDIENIKTMLRPVVPESTVQKVISYAIKKATIEETVMEAWRLMNPLLGAHFFDRDNLLRT